MDYLEAGADILITASYQVPCALFLLYLAGCVTSSKLFDQGFLVEQATIQGFQSKGFSVEQSEALLRKSVTVACEAREIFYKKHTSYLCNSSSGGMPFKERSILVAASIGSYGAYLADGSEYRLYYAHSFLSASSSVSDVILFNIFPWLNIFLVVGTMVMLSP